MIWPAAIQQRKWITIVSSRLSTSLDDWPDWFRALRATIAAIDETQELLFVCRDTTTFPYVRRAAALFGKSVVEVHLPGRDAPSPLEWLKFVLSRTLTPANPQASAVYVSPELPNQPGRLATGKGTAPLRDRALFATGEKLYALHVQRRSHTLRLLERRLQQPACPSRRTFVAIGRQLIDDAERDELLDLGAVGFAVLPPHQPQIASSSVAREDSESSQPSAATGTISAGSLETGWRFLTHCTRRRTGPWPDQTRLNFVDDLILERSAADHSALASLKRILLSQRLVASTQTVRGDVAVVSFTAVPLAELQRLRVFRPHRGRWDFEPYGLCISTQWLTSQGTKPVRYVEELNKSDEAARTFEQKSRSTTKSGGTLDWTLEQEWRYEGDLDLSAVPDHEAFVFVSDQASAQALRPLCRWPIVAIEADHV
jgi:hypothetical protein